MKKMTVALCAAVTVAAGGALADSIDDIGNVRLKGHLGKRLDAMIANHVAAQDVDYVTAPFMEKTECKGWWQTEFWGKWMHSSVPYLRYVGNGEWGTGNGSLRSKIERGIERMLASQEPSGYIGNYPDELRCGEGWDVWGMKYTMMGLLHYYDWVTGKGERVTGERALDAAKRLCDYVIAEIGPGGRRGRELWQTGNWSGYASSSILEPVVWLYKRVAARDGRDVAQKYLDFAAYIVEGMTKPEKGPRLIDLALKGVSVADRNEPDFKGDGEWSYVCKHGRSKAYEMMSCYQGLLDYVEVGSGGVGSGGVESEDLRKIRQAAIMTAEDIVKEEINLAGGCACSEAWFHGARKQHLPYTRLQETCVTTTWMRFCEKLLSVTDDPKWADQPLLHAHRLLHGERPARIPLLPEEDVRGARRGCDVQLLLVSACEGRTARRTQGRVRHVFALSAHGLCQDRQSCRGRGASASAHTRLEREYGSDAERQGA